MQTAGKERISLNAKVLQIMGGYLDMNFVDVWNTVACMEELATLVTSNRHDCSISLRYFVYQCIVKSLLHC